MNRALVPTTPFQRAARRLVKKDREAAEALQSTLGLLAQDAFAPRLKTHKLRGNLDGVWSCSAGYDLRVLFEFIEHEAAEAILLLSVGTHDEVY